MVSEIKIRLAQPSEAEIVGKMAYEMECELWPEQKDTLDRTRFIDAAKKLSENNAGYWAFLAIAEDDEIVGILTLNECSAIYAGGKFGEIPEIYVSKSKRSAGVGAMLVDAASEFGRKLGWPFLEVGAPGLPKWQRTVDFYRRKGFREIGPRLELQL
ncbi:MAG: GNAT family N-acetyltransferase [Desulfobacterales bacterium]|nr:GNAT family N-acetyltransferase [Desulfobacterales bacterium]